jgi:aminoglycoside 3-N-acetyltransferase
LALHSSLSSLGHVEGGALTVIRALQEVITEKGALIMPTHTSSLSCNDNGPFHPKNPDAKNIRASFPTPFGEWRASKEACILPIGGGMGCKSRLAHRAPFPFIYAFEENTPFHKAALMGGKILLLGVKNTRNSSIHVVEHLADAPYLEASYPVPEGTVYLTEQDDGSVREYPLTRYIRAAVRTSIYSTLCYWKKTL